MDNLKCFRIVRNKDGGIADYITGKNCEQAYWDALLQCQRNLPRVAKEGFRLEECTHSERRRWEWIDWRSVDALEQDMICVDSF